MGTASEERGYRRLSSIFQVPILDAKTCFRCKSQVFQAEKMGPVHDVLFHKTCFKCVVCGTFLNIKNYYSNQMDATDREIYCHAHVPRIGAAKYDRTALGIKQAVDTQSNYRKISKKLNPHIRKPGTMRNPNYNYQALAIKAAVSVPKVQSSKVVEPSGNIDANAVHIKGAMDAQLLLRGNEFPHDPHHFPPNIYKKRQRLIDAQKRLEEQLRKEEDAVIDEMLKKRSEETQKISDEMKREWEVRLKELTEKFDREMGRKSKKLRDSEKKQMTIHFENQKRELGDMIATKKAKKKESMTIRIREKEQQKMATLVAKQSQQMLELLAAKQEELKQEIVQELPTNGGTAEPDVIENVLEAIEVTTTELPPPHPPSCRKKELFADANVFKQIDDHVIQVAKEDHLTYTDMMQKLTENIPNDIDKARAIYRWITVKDLNMIEFDEMLDTDTPMGLLKGIKYGTETYHVLFMRLCSYAGLHCKEIKGHSKSVGYEPGMKIEPDTFQNTWNAVLIDGDWRLVQCNWGARHLVLNKDKQKADSPRDKENAINEKKEQEKKEAEKKERERKEEDGKQGENGEAKKEHEKDKESNAEGADDSQNGKEVRDTIRYQYDEHYFLTDPDEFIQEFWPLEPEWQLLENPITKAEFEALPFVRSVFFHFGMHFERGLQSVIETSEKGGCDIRIKASEELENEIVFFYQLRYADKERRHEAGFRGAYLERFVYMTVIENTVMFSVHVPAPGEYFFEVFANRIDEADRLIGDGSDGVLSSFRLKCACKFKIVCKSLEGKMHPLPECAAGEWGPKKALRHFGIKALSVKHPDKDETVMDDSSETNSSKSDGEVIDTQLKETPDNHRGGIVNVNDTVDLVFKLSQPLQFVTKLRMNSVESKTLDPFVRHTVENGKILRITVTPPQTGQYGLDVYARPVNSANSKLSHAFKYLLNCLKVAEPVEIPKVRTKSVSKREQWGPSPVFEQLGLKTVSHSDPKIETSESNQITIELFVPKSVSLSHHFIREPGEDIKDRAVMVRNDSKPEKVQFIANLPETGNYMLAIYARMRDGETKNLTNVYNYLIVYKKPDPENTFTSKEKKTSGSIFRKGLFKKSEKDKSK